MSNRSYCRFENTDRDLADREHVLEEMFAGEHDPLSDEELRAAKRLVNRCINIIAGVADYAGIDIDLDELERAIEETLDTANADCEARNG